MPEDRTRQILVVRDGSKLGYAEYGDPAGTPVVYCHGSPGSRLDMLGLEPAMAGISVRLIAPDRPGIGLSDFVPGYTLLDWPHMLVELAETLELERFAVLGLSGGGPFSAACAYAIPERISRVAIVSGVGSYDAPGAQETMSDTNNRIFGLARRANWLLRFQYWMMASGLERDPDRVRRGMLQNMPEPDRIAIEENPEVLEALLASMHEALRSGTKAVGHEWSLYVRPWGFRLEEITSEVDLWHGEADMNAPAAMGRQMAMAIPNCSAHFLPDEGHISLYVHHGDKIFASLVA